MLASRHVQRVAHALLPKGTSKLHFIVPGHTVILRRVMPDEAQAASLVQYEEQIGIVHAFLA